MQGILFSDAQLYGDVRAGVVCAYVSEWIRKPDPGSEFAAQAAFLRTLTDEQAMQVLVKRNYDGLLFFHEENIIAHMFYQQHDDQLHVFSMFIQPPYRRACVSGQMMTDFLTYANNRPDVSKVRFGKGENRAMNRLYDRLFNGSIPPPCSIASGVEPGWVLLQKG